MDGENIPPSTQVDVNVLEPGDVPAIVPIFLNSFAGYMSAGLGPGYAAAMIRWFAAAEDGAAFVARHEGEACGFVFGAPVGYGYRMNRDLLPVAVRSVLARPWVLLQKRVLAAIAGRLRVLAGLEPKPSDETRTGALFSLVGIGVHTDARRLGAGRLLMDRFEQEVVSRGLDGLRLSVYRDNAAARALYERMGWEPVETGRPAIYYVKMFQ